MRWTNLAFHQLHDTLIATPSLTTRQKAHIMSMVGSVEKCLVDGADEHLQLLDCALQTARIVSVC